MEQVLHSVKIVQFLITCISMFYWLYHEIMKWSKKKKYYTIYKSNHSSLLKILDFMSFVTNLWKILQKYWKINKTIFKTSFKTIILIYAFDYIIVHE